jgi:hypothetical protein
MLCRNLIALCVIIFFQSNLSLRTQILNPLLVILVVLASTAALVSHEQHKVFPQQYNQFS